MAETRPSGIDGYSLAVAKVLGEVLLLQRWAGGTAIPADRVFGLRTGFESVLEAELEHRGISREVQDRVEDLLQEIDQETHSTSPIAIKDWLRRERIDETIAGDVMQLCRLQSRFPDVIDQIIKEPGSPFSYLRKRELLPNSQWFGSLHFVELVDASGESEKKLHGVFAPSVPRIGEFIEPQGGQLMKVVDVGHVAITMDDSGNSYPVLVPHVYLEPIEDDSDSEIDADESDDSGPENAD